MKQVTVELSQRASERLAGYAQAMRVTPGMAVEMGIIALGGLNERQLRTIATLASLDRDGLPTDNETRKQGVAE